MASGEPTFALGHTVDVHVPAETLFDYLVSSDLLARWLAPGALVEPRIGGEVRVPQADGSVASGRVIAIERPHLLCFSWGYDDPAAGLAPDESTVEITLTALDDGTTRIALKHVLPVRAADHDVWPEAIARLATQAGGTDAPSQAGNEAPPLEPHLWCDDLGHSRRFYEEALGFRCVASYPGDADATWHQMRRGAVRLMIAARPDDRIATGEQAYLLDIRDRIGQSGAVSLYLRVDDARRDLDRCRSFGAEIVEPLWDPFWGGRQFTVRDPDGQLWTLTGPTD